MDREDVRRFALRDWQAVEQSKRDHWAARLESEGVEPLLEMAEGLREFVRSTHPDWPTEEDREADLAHHVLLKRLLDAAGDAITGR